MPRLTRPVAVETTFGTYTIQELIGEGGAGRVYCGVDADGMPIAVKVLAEDRATGDKRRRFKNEIAFLTRNKHPNIVNVFDHGIAHSEGINGPFYVMRRYDGSLRNLIQNGIAPDRVLPLFTQVLDGVEAAHLQGVTHRDLKPENLLWDNGAKILAVADFGIARFAAEVLATSVETGPAQRLANFQYAAPEQRVPGQAVEATADIYALGLILNELFTRTVPYGTEPRTITQVAPEHGFLDAVVQRMLRQVPSERPGSIADVKRQILQGRADAVSLQKLSKINGTVIKATDIDEPLALVPPRIMDADWNGRQLILTLDRPVTQDWINALYQMGSYSSVLGKPPQVFTFQDNRAFVEAREYEVQVIIDNFKQWLPKASQTLKRLLEEAARRDEALKKEQLRREREAEEQRLRVRRNIRL